MLENEHGTLLDWSMRVNMTMLGVKIMDFLWLAFNSCKRTTNDFEREMQSKFDE
jgi:hypothetical protein